jgi:hypothetical protein
MWMTELNDYGSHCLAIRALEKDLYNTLALRKYEEAMVVLKSLRDETKALKQCIRTLSDLQDDLEIE